MNTGHYHWFQDDERFPYFTSNGMDVIVNRSRTHADSGIEAKWTFLGDGELVVTAGISPYFPGLFRVNPIKVAALEAQFQDLEKQGYKIATVTEYVEALRAAAVEPEPLLPILDSPWRPNDGSGLFQWMGKYATPWERDWDMRTKNWQVRAALIEAERAGASDEVLATAWGHMLNAEVTDPSGWYPFPVEIDWDYEMMDNVGRAIRSVPGLDVEASKTSGGMDELCGRDTVAAPMEMRSWGKAAGAEPRWTELKDGGGYCLAVSWTGKGDGGVALPWTAENVEYSPAMMEHMVRVIPVRELKGNNIHLGLPNGLIGLGDAQYLVRDNRAGCVAAGVDFKDRQIRFEIQNGKEQYYAFGFYLLAETNADAALDFANKVNNVAP